MHLFTQPSFLLDEIMTAVATHEVETALLGLPRCQWKIDWNGWRSLVREDNRSIDPGWYGKVWNENGMPAMKLTQTSVENWIISNFIHQDSWARIDFTYGTYQMIHWWGLKVHIKIHCNSEEKCLPHLFRLLICRCERLSGEIMKYS